MKTEQVQQQVFRRDQLAALGVSSSAIRSALRHERWQRLSSHVVVCHNGPLSVTQQHWAAVLNAAPLAALAGRTAASCAGLQGWSDEVIDIVVPRGRARSVIPLPGVPIRVHESRRFTAADLHPSRLPPQTRMERALIDAAGWSASPRSACGLLAAGVQQRLVTPQLLRAELAKAGRIRHHALLRAALVDIEGGAQALSEIDFGVFCRRHRLPPPVRQQVRLDAQGRRRYLDVTLRGPDGTVLHLEIDGGLHLLVRSYWDDMQRDNELLLAGVTVLRFPSIALRLQPQLVADQIRRGLGLPGPASRPFPMAL